MTTKACLTCIRKCKVLSNSSNYRGFNTYSAHVEDISLDEENNKERGQLWSDLPNKFYAEGMYNKLIEGERKEDVVNTFGARKKKSENE